MSTQTKIEWCDSTFNPWIGCTKVSPACDNCYAEADFDLRRHRVKWGARQARSRTSAENWHLPVKWNKQQFVQCPNCGWRGDWKLADARNGCCPACNHLPELFIQARRRVFCASLADVFDNEVPTSWRAELFQLIANTPNLDWLLLTKRIGNSSRMIAEATAHVEFNDGSVAEWTSSNPWPNVWIGATICNQAEADRDIPKLLAVPAEKRFLSIEPMLGPVSLLKWFDPTGACCMREMGHCDGCPAEAEWIHGPTTVYADDGSGFRSPEIDWVIVGGESGPNARPMHPYWVRRIRDQCTAAGVPFLFKQWGEWSPRAKICGAWKDFQSIDPSCEQWPNTMRLGEHGRDTRIAENCTRDMGEDVYVQRVGKANAGRHIDGRTWEQFP